MSRDRRCYDRDPVGEWIFIIGLVLFALGMAVAPFVGMWAGRAAPGAAADAGEVRN